MFKPGDIIKNQVGEGVLVFAEVSAKINEYLTKQSVIGCNLRTRRIEEVVISALEYWPTKTLAIQELSKVEANSYEALLPAFVSISRRTLAITAKARSGKDHMALEIKKNLRPASRLLALAEPIREIAESIDGQVEGKNRPTLIMIGQGLRFEDPNIWIKVWLRRAIEFALRPDMSGIQTRFICQDLRQPNEFSFFTNLGATIVTVVADEEKRLAKIEELDGKEALDKALLADETEKNAGSYNTPYVIQNNYDDNYNKEIQTFYEEVLVAQKGW